MYSTPILPVGREYADECGFTMKYTGGNSVGTTGWLGIWFQFAAMQIGFRQVSGSSSGGGHFGMMWGQTPDPGHWNLNFGFYDDVAGGGVSVRGTRPQTYPGTQFFDAGGEDSYFWYRGGVPGTQGLPYGDTFQCRVFVSPKQNWTAAELSPGFPQPEYNNVNQKTSGTLGAETAIRMIFRTKKAGETGWTPWVWFRDILFKNLATSKPMQGPILWTENTLNHDAGSPPTVPDGDWPGNPTWQFRDVVWDGRRVAKTFLTEYAAADISPSTKKSDVRLITDDSVQWIQHISNNSGLTRQTPHLTVLTPTEDTFWEPAPSNVSPNPSGDPSARVATPRPWW